MNIKIINKSINSIKSQFNSKLWSCNDPSVIYQVPSNSCDKSYIGETSDIKRRTTQHRYSLRTADFNNAMVKHSYGNSHAVNLNNSKVIHKENNVNK